MSNRQWTDEERDVFMANALEFADEHLIYCIERFDFLSRKWDRNSEQRKAIREFVADSRKYTKDMLHDKRGRCESSYFERRKEFEETGKITYSRASQ